ncbi:hypothetical protein C0989_001397 [Termitomyces sp. Mn162]|nr:hypothetical protein C0989_001397 [Termitomyces sp. Mn162]
MQSPAMTGITKYHNNALTLDNDLRFQAWLLVTQLSLSTPIVLELLWLQDVNPDIDWMNLTMRFPSFKASLVAAIPLCIQSTPDSDIPNVDASIFRETQSPSTLNDCQGEDNVPLPQSPLSKT